MYIRIVPIFLLQAVTALRPQQRLFKDDVVKDGGLRGRGNPLDAGFEELVMRNLEHFNVPGVAVAVVDGGETFAEVCLF